MEVEDGLSDEDWEGTPAESADPSSGDPLGPEATTRGGEHNTDLHELTVLYACDTGTVYTINDDFQSVDIGNYLAEGRSDNIPIEMPPGKFASSYDPETYAMCRENQPHDMFPPCTSCFGALQDEGIVGRLDAD